MRAQPIAVKRTGLVEVAPHKSEVKQAVHGLQESWREGLKGRGDPAASLT